MNDKDKTRTQLIDELCEARRRIAELEVSEVEHKRVEQALKQSEARLTEVQRIARLGDWEHDLINNQEYWSNETCRICGLDPQQFDGKHKTFLNLVHPEDKALVEQAIQEALDGVKPYDIDFRVVLPDGTERFVHSFAEVTRDETGRPVRMVGTLQDITERKQAEGALWESEDRFPQVITSISDHIYVTEVTEDGRHLNRYLSPHVESLTGYSYQSFADDWSFWPEQTIHPDDRAAAAGQVAQLLRGQDSEMEYRLVRADGRIIWVRDSARVESEGSSKVIYGVVSNITERKRVEKKLRLLQTIMQAVSEAQDFYSALEVVLQEVCQATGWNYGEAWIPSPDGTVLEYGPTWHRPTNVLKHFGQLNQGVTFRPGHGLPGRVWLSKRSEWVPDVSSESNEFFYRAEAAQAANLRAGFGVPLIVNQQVLAVLVFFMLEARQEDERLVEVVSTVATQLSSIIQRKQLEEALRQAEEKYRSIFENAVEGIFQSTPDGRFFMVNPAFARILGYESPTELIKRIDIRRDFYVVSTRRAEFERLLAEHDTVQGFESQVYRRDGSIIWLSENARTVRDTDGQLLYYEGIVKDITERRLLEERRSKELTALNQASQAMASSLDLDTVLEQTMTEIQAVLTAEGAAVLLLEPNGDELVFAAAASPVAKDLVGMRLPLTEGVAGWTVRKKQSVLIKDAQHDPRFYKGIDAITGLTTRTILAVPLRFKDRVIGLIEVTNKTEGVFTQQDLEMLETLASSAAIAIKNAQLFEQAQQEVTERKRIEKEILNLNEELEQRVIDRTRELVALYEVTAVASESLDLQTTLEQLLDRSLTAMRSNVGTIHVLDETGQVLRLDAHQGLSPDIVSQVDSVPVGSSLPGWVIEHGEPWLVSDLTIESRAPQVFGRHGLQTYMGVPMRTGGATVGVLSIFGESQHQFNIEDVALLASIGDQVGVVMENARLRQRAEKAAVMEERQRLARELHDSVTQSLYALTLFAEAGGEFVKTGDLEAVEHNFAHIGKITQQALKEMRLLVHELQPLDLEQEGLVGALRKRLNDVEKRVKIKTRLIAEELIELPVSQEEGLYRIAQEALNNSLKHAAATSVTIYFRVNGEAVELEVVDNGLGFDPNIADNAGGMGLANIRGRAEKLGGSLIIHSRPGEGTSVKVQVKVDGLRV